MTDKGGPATLLQVAQMAGVSLATASRALNGSSRKVNPALQAQVLAAAAKLGYSANVQAQAVARGTSKIVSLVIGDIADPYFSAIASGVIHVANERGLTVTIAATGSGLNLSTTMTAIRGQRPRAVVIAKSLHFHDDDDALIRELNAIEALGGRVAFIASNQPGHRSVPVLNHEASGALARALVERGYRRFAVLSGDGALAAAADRAAGFVEAVRSLGLEIAEQHIVPGALSREGGFHAAEKLLANEQRLDCIFAVSDVMAVGAMNALRKRGLHPGEDIAVAGFDDIELARDVSPSLTTVAIPLADIGARALALALGDDPIEGHIEPAFPGTVMIRESTPAR